MLVYNAEKRLFLGERFGSPNIWQFPQGGVEEGATLEENVVRELNEELGLKPAHIGTLRRLSTTHEYEWERPPEYAVGKWRGQSQTFWLVQFVGHDQDIHLTAHETPEFMAWRWVAPGEVESLAEPRRLGGYRPALQEACELLRSPSR